MLKLLDILNLEYFFIIGDLLESLHSLFIILVLFGFTVSSAFSICIRLFLKIFVKELVGLLILLIVFFKILLIEIFLIELESIVSLELLVSFFLIS